MGRGFQRPEGGFQGCVCYLFRDKELACFYIYIVNDASAALEVWDEIKSENCDCDFEE